MFRLANFMCVLCCLIGIGSTRAHQTFSRFDDSQTLNYDNYGQTVEDLGRLVKLRTSVSHYKKFPCSFTIMTRAKETEVVFKPQRYCFLGLCDDYKFDPNLLASSGFNPNLRTIILIAGYLHDQKVDWYESVAQLWLKIEEVNVIKVSWIKGNRYFYETAVSGTPIVAREITILLHHLAAMNGLRFTDEQFAKRIQIVGHSLGAHIGAFVGQDLGGRLGRITGLDPAGVFFDLQPRDLRLDPSDARFVDVFHTNAGKFRYHNLVLSAPQATTDWLLDKIPLISKLHARAKVLLGEGYTREANTSWFGIDQQVGHIDYYANDGRVQPDCDSYLHVCDHGRSFEIYRDFLSYELHHYNDNVKAIRLLAFKADDYVSFLTGSNLAQNCRQILDIGGPQQQQRENLQESMKRCSLPIDLTSPVDDLIREYTKDYGVETLLTKPELDPTAGTKYYFSTRAQEPFVGHHFMLKVYPANDEIDESQWGSACSLKVEMKLSENENVVRVTMLKDPKQSISIRKIIGGELVFTALFTAPIQEPLTSRHQNPWTSDEVRQLGLLPSYLNLTVSSLESSHSAPMAILKKIGSYFTISPRTINCSIRLRQIEILPMINSEHAFLGRYPVDSLHSTIPNTIYRVPLEFIDTGS